MARVGERLRNERESRNTSLDDLSLASGIGRSYLEALEQGEIDALPGPAFGKLYIRAYAEVLGFDPQPWIDDYDRERRLMEGAAPEPVASTGPRPVAAAIAEWKKSLHGGRELVDAAGDTSTEPQPLHAADPDDHPDPPARDPRTEESTLNDEPERVSAESVNKLAATVAEPAALRRLVPMSLALSIGLVALVVYFAARDSSTPAPAPAAAPNPAAVPAAAPTPAASPSPAPAPATVPAEPPPPVAAKPAPVLPVKPPPVERAGAPGALSVTESGTARRILNGRLDGVTTEFSEGDAVVFQTRVLGGGRGEIVRHVWIYDGRAQQSISLRLGGPDFRTYSKKTLYKRGPWSVEARDGSGRVLAAAAFSCVPRSR